MIPHKKTVLSNGLRIITAPLKNTETATFLVLIGVGSRFETKNINGISHFLEHLVFKGTKLRPEPGQVHRELDQIGASHNAFTSKEVTGFWVKSSAEDVNVGLDIIGDILLNPIFRMEEIERERGVILQEISMYEDEPRRKVWDVLESVMFGNQPVGWDIAGNKETVGSIGRGDIVRYRERNYLAKNMVVVAVGDIDEKKILPKIKKIFGHTKKGMNAVPLKFVPFQENPQVRFLKKESDQTHLAMAFRAYDMFDERRHALDVLSVILGGNFSSRLFSEIREKLGLAYYVFSFGDHSTDCGYLALGAGVAHTEADRTIKKIAQILRDIKKKGVSKTELDLAKSFIRGQTALKLEPSDEIANFLATLELFYNKIYQPEELMEKIEKVKRNDILKVAQEIFVPDRANLVSISANDMSEDFYKKLFLNYFK